MRIYKRYLLFVGLVASLFILSIVSLWRVGHGKPIISIPSSETPPSILSIEVPELVPVGQPFDIKVVMNTQKNPVNAAGIYLKFDPTRFQVLDLDTKESFCQFYPEKKYDNTMGQILLACGAPHPGYKGVNTLLKINLMPLVIGTSELVTLPQSQLLVSDGKGSNALQEKPRAVVHVIARP